MKTKEELNAIREEVETLNNKLKELTDEELTQVTGGSSSPTKDDKYKFDSDYCDRSVIAIRDDIRTSTAMDEQRFALK